jgi:hypothetical protein
VFDLNDTIIAGFLVSLNKVYKKERSKRKKRYSPGPLRSPTISHAPVMLEGEETDPRNISFRCRNPGNNPTESRFHQLDGERATPSRPGRTLIRRPETHSLPPPPSSWEGRRKLIWRPETQQPTSSTSLVSEGTGEEIWFQTWPIWKGLPISSSGGSWSVQIPSSLRPEEI